MGFLDKLDKWAEPSPEEELTRKLIKKIEDKIPHYDKIASENGEEERVTVEGFNIRGQAIYITQGGKCYNIIDGMAYHSADKTGFISKEVAKREVKNAWKKGGSRKKIKNTYKRIVNGLPEEQLERLDRNMGRNVLIFTHDECSYSQQLINLLNELNVGYTRFSGSHTLSLADNKNTEDEMERWLNRCNDKTFGPSCYLDIQTHAWMKGKNKKQEFPMIVVDQKHIFIGFDENKIRQLF